MADRPILFSAPMVRALLDGRKTQTRRVMPPGKLIIDISSEAAEDFELRGWDTFWYGEALCAASVRHEVGDRLWVREAWRADEQVNAVKPIDLSKGEPVQYEADKVIVSTGCSMIRPGKLRPSMFMPRWASRLTLTVTDVRVQRLQDITATDARSEGVFVPEAQYAQQGYRAPILAYAALWEDINGPGTWDLNPWVAAYTFTVERRNIDAGGAHG